MDKVTAIQERVVLGIVLENDRHDIERALVLKHYCHFFPPWDIYWLFDYFMLQNMSVISKVTHLKKT
jgi:hypothetical protein